MATKQEKLELLGAVPLFSDLSKKDLTKVLATAKDAVHHADQEVVTEGHGGVGFHLIVDGQVQVVRGGRNVATLGPGEPRRVLRSGDARLTPLTPAAAWTGRPPAGGWRPDTRGARRNGRAP